MHGLQKCTLPIFIQAVRLLQTGWFQNQPTGSSVQTGPDRTGPDRPCRASSFPRVEVQCASLHNFVVVLLKIDNQEEQFSRLSPDQRKMEDKKEVDWIIFVFSRHLSVSHLDASQLGEVVWKWRWHFTAPPGPLGDKKPCHQTAVVTFPIRAYSHLLWQHSDSDPQNGNVDISFSPLLFSKRIWFTYQMWFPVCFLYVYCWAVGVMMPPVHRCKYERWGMKERRVLCTGQQQRRQRGEH